MSNEQGSTGRDSSQVQVLTRATNLIKIVGKYPGGISLSDLMQDIDLPRSTVYRIISSLEANGFVAWDKAAGVVRLGIAVALLSQNLKFDLRVELAPFLQELNRELGEAVDLSIWQNNNGILVERINGIHMLQVAVAVGSEFPLYCTACGKAMLSLQPDEVITELFPQELSYVSERSIKTRDKLMEELEYIRNTGLAFDREEQDDGVCAVSFAFKDPFGIIAAVSIPIPSIRFYNKEQEIVEAVRRVAKAVEERFRLQ